MVLQLQGWKQTGDPIHDVMCVIKEKNDDYPKQIVVSFQLFVKALSTDWNYKTLLHNIEFQNFKSIYISDNSTKLELNLLKSPKIRSSDPKIDFQFSGSTIFVQKMTKNRTWKVPKSTKNAGRPGYQKIKKIHGHIEIDEKYGDREDIKSKNDALYFAELACNLAFLCCLSVF